MSNGPMLSGVNATLALLLGALVLWGSAAGMSSYLAESPARAKAKELDATADLEALRKAAEDKPG